MAGASKYHWTSGGRRREAWRARWVGADGKPKFKRGFDREGDALKYAQDREVEARHGVELEVDEDERPSGRTTVKAWSKTWLDGLDVRQSSRETYEMRLKHVLPTLGGRTLASLRPSEIKAWRRGLARKDGRPLADSTADAAAAVLAMMLRAAVQDGLIPRSPMPPSRGGRRRQEGRVVDPDELLTLEQVLAWGAAMPAHAREMPLVAATTGLRQGELLGLQMPAVDFLRRRIRVDPALGQAVSRPGEVVLAEPKTPASARTLPLPAVTADALNRHLVLQPPVAGEPIFRGARFGQRWRRQSFWAVWEKARVEAGLPDWVHWHSLRDVFASSLIRKGVDVRTVMTLMGHRSAEETLRTYARLWPDAEDVARKALDEVWSADPDDEVEDGPPG